jgi:protein-L-isoaspartate(D-aspartate) O-methyltransferase
MTVLEIGTGSGYSTALLAHLVGREGHVVSMDVVPELVDRARMLLSVHGYANTTVLQADGMHGTPAQAPFDRVAAWATAPHLPTSWIAQLAPEGLIVAPMLLAPISKSGVGTRIRVAEDRTTYADQLFPAGFVEMHDEEMDQWLVPPYGIDALCRDDAGRAWWLSGTWLRGHEGDSHGWHLLDSLTKDRHEVAGPLELGEPAGDFRAWLLATRPDGLTTAALGDPTWRMGYAHSSGVALTDMRTATKSITSGDPDAPDVLTTWANAWRQRGRLLAEGRPEGEPGVATMVGDAPAPGSTDHREDASSGASGRGKPTERRDFLRLSLAAASAPLALAQAVAGAGEGAVELTRKGSPVGPDVLEAVTSVTRGYRRLWSSTPGEELRDPVLGHLRLIARLLASTTSEKDQVRLAAAGSETALLAAWLAEDLWDFGAVSRHYQAAQSYAERAQNDVLCAYVEGCRSYWASRTGNATEAVGAIRRATHLLPGNAPATSHVWIAARQATAHAAAHDEPAMSSALLQAEKALDENSGSGETTWPWVFPIDHGELSRYRGIAAASLELPRTALPALEEGLGSVGTAPSKRRSYTLGKLAEVHVLTGDIEQACDLAVDVFTIATQLSDTESLMAVRRLRTQLVPVAATPAVRAFDDRVLSSVLGLNT